MKYLIFVFVLFPFLFIVACGGDERADTIELPIATNTVEPTELIPILEETAISNEKLTNTPTPEATPTNTPLPTNTPKPINMELTKEQLLASHLTIDDMPMGWTWLFDDSPGPFATVSEAPAPVSFCEESIEYNVIGGGKAEFALKQDDNSNQIHQDLVYFENARIAEDAFADISNSFGCLGMMGNDSDTYSPLSFPKLGDDTFAVKFNDNFEDYIIEGAMIILREDNIITLIHHTQFSSTVVNLNTLVTEEIAIKALERIKENN